MFVNKLGVEGAIIVNTMKLSLPIQEKHRNFQSGLIWPSSISSETTSVLMIDYVFFPVVRLTISGDEGKGERSRSWALKISACQKFFLANFFIFNFDF
jgi:hypothetical protein